MQFALEKPSISYDEILQFAQEGLGISLKRVKKMAKNLEGTTYCLIKDEKTRFVIYVLQKNYSEEYLLKSVKFQQYLSDLGFPVPRVLCCGTIREKTSIITDFVPGKIYAHWHLDSYEHVGFLLASLHKASDRYPDTLDTLPEILRLEQTFYSLQDHLSKEFFVLEKEIGQICALWPCQLPKGFIHNDFWFKSFLFEQHKVQAILDFHAPYYDIFLLDLASLVKGIWFLSDDNRRCTHLKNLLKGYQKARPFSFEEKEYLPLLVGTKMVSTILYLLKMQVQIPTKAEYFKTMALSNLYKLQEIKEFPFRKTLVSSTI